MHVFLCWSGAASHKIAEALHSFLGDVIQDIKPFLSSESIRKGQRWNGEIGKRLADTNYGIVCLTKDNLSAPWILFESGALSKNIADSRVTALLAGIQPTDVIEPLSQFQQTRTDREDIAKLLKDLNELLPEDRRLEQDRLKRSFDSHWTEFQKKLDNAITLTEARHDAAPRRDTRDMVSELLELVREMKREVGPMSREIVEQQIAAAMSERITRLTNELATWKDRAQILSQRELELLKATQAGKHGIPPQPSSPRKKNDDLR